MKTNSYLTDLKKQQGLLAEYLRSIDVAASDEELLNELIQKLPDYTGAHVVYEHDSSGNVISAELHNFSEIPDYAFYNCATLQTITFIDCPITRIGKYAFYNCKNFRGFKIPEGVTEVGDYALYQCEKWVANVPTSIITIGKYAYAYTKITSVTSIPNVQSIGANAFDWCSSLKTFVFPEDHAVTLGTYLFRECGLTSVNLPDWMTSIPAHTFYCCRSLVLKDADLPTGVTSIGQGAFQATRCQFNNLPEGLVSIGSSAFCGTPVTGTVVVPSTVTSIGVGAWVSTSPTTIHFKCPITGSYDFGDYLNSCRVTNLIFEADVTPTDIFEGIPSLTRVWFRKGVTKQYAKAVDSTLYLWQKIKAGAVFYVEAAAYEIPEEWHANWNKRSASSTITTQYGVTAQPW